MKDALHSLIHSLSKSEKRYFKLFVSQNVKQQHSLHLELFDRIVAMPEYDEVQLIEWYAQDRPAKHLPASKHQLRKIILKSLRAFGSAATPTSQLRERMMEIKILFEKRLPEQALKLQQLTAKKAKALEAFEVANELLSWEMDILLVLRPPDLYPQLSRINALRADLLAKIRVEQILKGLHVSLVTVNTIRFRSNNDEVASEIQRIAAHPLLMAPPMSRLSALLQASIKGLRALMTGQYQEAKSIYLGADPQWDANPAFILDHEEFYMQFQFNLLNSCLYSESADELQEQLEKLKLQVRRLKGDLLKHQQKIYFIELLYVMNFSSGREAEVRVAGILRWLERNGDKILPASLYFFHYNSAVFYFLRGSTSESLKHVNWILNFNPKEIRKDMVAFARVFQLVLHFEQENVDFIEYRLRALRRKAGTTFNVQGLELQLLVLFEKVLKLPVSEFPAQFKALKSDIDQQVAEATGRPPLGYQELLYWLDSRIEGKPISEIYAIAQK